MNSDPERRTIGSLLLGIALVLGAAWLVLTTVMMVLDGSAGEVAVQVVSLLTLALLWMLRRRRAISTATGTWWAAALASFWLVATWAAADAGIDESWSAPMAMLLLSGAGLVLAGVHARHAGQGVSRYGVGALAPLLMFGGVWTGHAVAATWNADPGWAYDLEGVWYALRSAAFDGPSTTDAALLLLGAAVIAGLMIPTKGRGAHVGAAIVFGVAAISGIALGVRASDHDGWTNYDVHVPDDVESFS